MSKCIFCGGKATLLCDHSLGWERMRSQLASDAPNLLEGPCYEVPARYRIYHTCDAALCRACAIQKGSVTICLRGGRGYSDTYDYCPGHQPEVLPKRELGPGRADALRADWRARVKKKVVKPPDQFDLAF